MVYPLHDIDQLLIAEETTMKHLLTTVFLGLCISALLTACGPSEEEIGAIQTQAVEDVYATETASAPTATSTPTETLIPTATFPPTDTPTPTNTPSPTPSPLPTSTPCSGPQELDT